MQEGRLDGFLHQAFRAVSGVTTTWAERVAEHVRLFGVDPEAADKSRRSDPVGVRKLKIQNFCENHIARLQLSS